MARKGNPISVRLDFNRSSDSSWFSDYYYGKLVYQDLNLRSYFDKIHPPTRRTFGFRVGRCIILHFPKRTCISCFIPRLPRVLKKRRKKSRARRKAKKDWLWKFWKVDPISCLHSRDGTEKDRKEMIGRESGKRVESIKLDGWEKQNKRRSWATKKEGYRYHDRSKKNLSKLLQVSGAFNQSTYAEVVNGIAFQFIGQKKKDQKRRKKSRSDSPTRLKRNFPAVRSSLNYLVIKYLLNQKNKMNFDPVVVLNHFVAPGVSESFMMGGQERSLDKRIRSRIVFFLESLTSENKKKEDKNNFTHFIRQVNDLRFGGRTKTSISLFPFFGATFFFQKDGLEVKKQILFENTCNTRNIRKKCLGLFQRKCWKQKMSKDKVKLIENFIDLSGKGEFRKGIEMMIEIILRNRRIPYGSNYALNEVIKMRSLLSNRTKTNTLMELVKIKYLYQSASLIAQDIALQLRTKKRSLRSIFSQIVKKIPKRMKKRVIGIRISCSGRLDGREIARTECGKYGKTSCNVFTQKMDYASTEVSTRYGILSVKVWISYSQKRKEHAISKTYEI